MFSSSKPICSSQSQGAKEKAQAEDLRTQEHAENSTSLKDILRFINSQFSEFDASSLHRQPHFKVPRLASLTATASAYMTLIRSRMATDQSMIDFASSRWWSADALGYYILIKR